MQVVRSPICSTSGLDASELSPGAKSMPGATAKDSVPEQKPAASSAPVSAHGALPEPSLKADGNLSAAEHHLVHHRLLRLGRG
jgi:hypothetical protein